MKKHYLTICWIIFLIGDFNAQNLVFDTQFNNNTSHADGIPPQDISTYDQGNLRQLNDSVFIYYKNDVNWNNNELLSDVLAKTIHSDGTVSYESVYSHQYYFDFYDPSIYTISDIVTANNRVFVIRNEAYDDNGLLKYGIHIGAYDYQNGFYIPSSWGAGSIQSSVNISEAKGTLLGTNVILAYRYSNSSTQIATSTVSSMAGNVIASAPTVLTNNPVGTISSVADIIAISSTEVYIADNSYIYTNSGSYSFNDMVHVLKYNPSTFTLSSDYTANGTGVSANMNWNTQINTPNAQDNIQRILYDNGKIIVAGYYNHYDGSPYSLGRGRVTRLNSNGTIDNTFAPSGSISGTFAPSFSADYFRWWFTDIDIKSDGKLLVSAHGTFGNNSPINPTKCFLLQLDNNGNLETGIGNDGRLFESSNFGKIEELIIVPGNSSLTDKFVFNGMHIVDPDPNFGASETSLNRLVWSSGGTTGLVELNPIELSVYPNPSNSTTTITTKENVSISILSSDGKQIAEFSGASQYLFDAGNLHNGIYFIQVENGATYKFIKN